jgi:transposase
VPTPYAKEFSHDVTSVARQGDQSIGQVARRFGISESYLSRWLRIADREDGLAAASPASSQWPAERWASPKVLLQVEDLPR